MGSAEAQQVQEGEVMNHPCNNWKCPEYNHGQCFGMGCSANPMPIPNAEEGDTENTQED